MTYENSGTGIDYPKLIERVYSDEVARHYFTESWYRRSATLFDARPRPVIPGDTHKLVRVSDAGTCRQQLWADLHDKLDIPDNPVMIDDKMEPGILDGARTAFLIAAGIERWYWPLTAVIEQAIDARGIPGHADVVVYAEPDPIEVIECKLTLYPKGIDDPETRHTYWLHQACKYALGVGAPFFVVLVHAPAAFTGATRQAFRYSTVEHAVTTEAEYARLREAQHDAAPAPDAPEDESWRCRSCRYSQCSEGRNVNPRRKFEEVIVDEIGVLQ
jgi:hypothetical protein